MTFVRLVFVKFALVSATPDKSVPVRFTFCIDRRGPIIKPFVAVDTVRATYPAGNVAVDTPTSPPPITVFVKTALVRVALVNVADVNVAPVKTAPVIFAPVSTVDDKNEFERLVFTIVAPLKLADVNITFEAVAFVRFAFVRVDDVNVALESTAPDKSIPVIFILVMI